YFYSIVLQWGQGVVIIYKKAVWTLFVLIAGLTLGFAFIFVSDVSKQENSDEAIDEMAEESDKEKEKAAAPEKVSAEGKALNPFGAEVKQDEMTEAKIMDYIHKMSHQKIHAEEKWGFIEITDERIDWLLESLEETTEQLEHKNVYEQILRRWQSSDFSHASRTITPFGNCKAAMSEKRFGCCQNKRKRTM